MKRTIEPLANAINAAIDDANSGRPGRRHVAMKSLERVTADVAAYFTVRETISAAIGSRGLTVTAIAIGSSIEEEIRLAAFDDQEPGLYSTIMRQLKARGAGAGHARKVFVFAGNKAGVELPRMTRVEKLHIGVRLIEMLVETTGFVTIANIRKGKKLKSVIQPTDAVAKWLEDRNNRAAFMAPQYAPMVAPPLDWQGLVGGGYLSELGKPLPLVKGANKAQHKALLEQADLTRVFRALNATQRTAWRINTQVFEVMNNVWERGAEIAMPSRDGQELPPRPFDIDTNDAARVEWKRAARAVHEDNASTKGKRIGIAQIVSMARELLDEEQLYFPHQLDFRGRAYAVPIGLHPQGSDHAKALLTFAASHGKPIMDQEAADWLMINGANLYGFDKADFEDRIEWVCERAERISYTATYPLEDLWWAEADKPWCFLAWCFEYAAFAKQGFGFVSTLPLSVDGSCNGLQHFSAMLRDPVGGAAVNLVPNDLPADIYQRVADRVLHKLDLTKSDWVARGWIDFGIDRKITKRPVMVLPYGGTFKSCMDYVRAAVLEKLGDGKENPFGDELGKATTLLSRLVWDSISDVVIAARQAMDWLQKCARAASSEGSPLSWTTPSGFPVFQSYMDQSHRRVKTRLQGGLTFLSVAEDGDQIAKGKQALAVSPNFVHSLDAAAMMLTINLALDNGLTAFAMIHDSYGTVAADMGILARCLRRAFVEMYEGHHVLEEFLNGLPDHVRPSCPPLPPLGSLDIKEVHNSQFFFA